MKKHASKKHSVHVSVGERLRDARKKSGLTQEELAFHADLNAKYVGCVERGEKDISVARLMRLLEVVGCPPSRFFADFPMGDRPKDLRSKAGKPSAKKT